MINSGVSPHKQALTEGVVNVKRIYNHGEMKFQYLPIGVFILSLDDCLVTHESWGTSGKTAVGVYLYNGVVGYPPVIIAHRRSPQIHWNPLWESRIVPGIPLAGTYSSQLLENSYGKDYTEQIIKVMGNKATAALFCKNYSYNSISGIWYLPAVAQYIHYCKNKSSIINSCITAIGDGSVFDGDKWEWSSTQCKMKSKATDAYHVWNYSVIENTLDNRNKSTQTDPARAFAYYSDFCALIGHN